MTYENMSSSVATQKDSKYNSWIPQGSLKLQKIILWKGERKQRKEVPVNKNQWREQ